ncbi:MAG: YggT family protein [Alphaproteobacteria bacterium]|nr:YggT family protein [Alphaproteobacteria bacterium]
MHPLVWLVYNALSIISFLLIVWIVISWLISFNILNTSNRFVYIVNDTLSRLFEPMLSQVRKYLPNMGSIDLSPIVIFLLIEFIKYCIVYYL